MAVIGIVAEGPSEAILLEELAQAVYPRAVVRRIQPDITLAAYRGAGWKGVRAWCRENGAILDVFMDGVEGDELDALVIHLDCSMAHNVGAQQGCPPPRGTAGALELVIAEWLGTPDLPSRVVPMVPSMTTDTWLYVGLGGPIPSRFDPIECSAAVEPELVRLHHYRRKDGQIKKPAAKVEELSRAVAANWKYVRTVCGEADLFSARLDALL